MAKINVAEIGLFTEIRKKLYRDMTVYPLFPYRGAGFVPALENGIYQMRQCLEGKIPIRMKFYAPPPSNTPAQKIWRDKYAAGVLAWQSLTTEQKAVYNERAKNKQFSGYNLYLRDCLLA